jgi:hypothetical protein
MVSDLSLPCMRAAMAWARSIGKTCGSYCAHRSPTVIRGRKGAHAH